MQSEIVGFNSPSAQQFLFTHENFWAQIVHVLLDWFQI